MVGGAARGKAIIVLNPAEPPLIMRDTVLLPGRRPAADHDTIRASVEEMVAEVPAYVPGYRLKQQVQITAVADDQPVAHPARRRRTTGRRTRCRSSSRSRAPPTTCPAYAGNLDIMTSAALRVAERIAAMAAARGGTA